MSVEVESSKTPRKAKNKPKKDLRKYNYPHQDWNAPTFHFPVWQSWCRTLRALLVKFTGDYCLNSNFRLQTLKSAQVCTILVAVTCECSCAVCWRHFAENQCATTMAENSQVEVGFAAHRANLITIREREIPDKVVLSNQPTNQPPELNAVWGNVATRRGINFNPNLTPTKSTNRHANSIFPLRNVE